jgi:hypothetical protein
MPPIIPAAHCYKTYGLPLAIRGESGNESTAAAFTVAAMELRRDTAVAIRTPPPRNSWKSQKAVSYFRDEFREDIETFAEQAEKDGLTPTVLEDYRK